VGHFHHRLRAAADDDQRFVQALAERLGLECIRGEAEPAALDLSEGLEAGARAVRYQFLQEQAERIGARYVATGHTADDQVETILHHVLRGTSLAGLSGMPVARALSPAVTLVRPLLGVRRRAVTDYLRQIGQSHCVDESNSSLELTRNRLRNELLPLLMERFNPQVDEALLRLGMLAGEVHAVMVELARQLAARAATISPDGVTIDCTALAGTALAGTALTGTALTGLALADAALAVSHRGPPGTSSGESLPRGEEPSRVGTRYVVREMFCQLWREAAWPLRAMTFDHWNLLANVALAAPREETVQHDFPGGVRVQRTGDRLRLWRPASSP